MGQGRQHQNKFDLLRILAQEALYRAVNATCEGWLGVHTNGKVPLASLGLHNSDWHEYAPVGYWAIFSALRKVPIAFRDMGFLDIGSGKGRPVIVAARLGCRRIIGVDVAPSLNAVARDNLASIKAVNAEIIEADAATYVIPADVNVLYLANSFKGVTLEALIVNIRRSYAAHPRPLYLICFNTRILDEHIRSHEWIQCIRRDWYYPGFTCGIYEISHVSSSHRRTCG